MGLFYFTFVYLLGGITFIPLTLALLFLHAHLTLPSIDPKRLAEESSDGLRIAGDEDRFIKSGGAASLDERFKGKHDSDLSEGYYAVCREYVPGGVNGKPPERPAGASDGGMPEQSPSVYQSMYRSLFARQQAPTLEPGKAIGRFSKKPRNVFYVVLRHGHLMLYDDEHQVEVRHVVSLAHHKIDLYGGGNEIPEGELWIKRNAIRLTRKGPAAETDSISKPFYFFSENCSDKEDFYHAMLLNQENLDQDGDGPPSTLHFQNEHIITLIQKLHSSEEQFQTRWLNALISRYFLAVYKTKFIEDLIRMKVTKKIARVKKPAFLTGIILRNIDMGKAAPLITNPRLRDLTIDGNCSVEADFFYEGNVRVEIAATVRIDLGARFKAREVQLVLAVTLKKLAGRSIVRFKPPPSNRIWIAFETMPKLELSIEPIWGSRQITYGVVLRQIESRIREVVAESLVLPFWDDIPFYDTEKLRCRGGIWAEDGQSSEPAHEIHVPDEAPREDGDTEATSLDQSSLVADDQRSASSPSLLDAAPKGLFSRKGNKAASLHEANSTASSSGVEKQAARVELPKTLRSPSSAAVPTVSTSNPDTVGVRHEGKQARDASTLMRETLNRSQPSSPTQTPVRLHRSRDDRSRSPAAASTSSTGPHQQQQQRPRVSSTKSQASLNSLDGTLDLNSPPATIAEERTRDPSPNPSIKSKSSIASDASAQSKLARLAESLTPSEAHQAQLAAISAAAANASRSWSWGIKKGKHSNSPSLSSASSFFGHSPSNSVSGTGTGATTPTALGNGGGNGNGNSASGNSSSSTGEPYGRGRPFPPVGQPLPPPPDRANTFAGAASAWMGSVKRKSVSNVHASPGPHRSAAPASLPDRKPSLPERKDSVSTISSTGTSASEVIRRRPVAQGGNSNHHLSSRRVSRAGLQQQNQQQHQQQGAGNGSRTPQGQYRHDDVVVVSAPQHFSSDDDEQPNVGAREGGALGEVGDLIDFEDMVGEEEGVQIEATEGKGTAAGSEVVGKGLLDGLDVDEVAAGGLPGEAAAQLVEANLATPLADGRRLVAYPSMEGGGGEGEIRGRGVGGGGGGKRDEEELEETAMMRRQPSGRDELTASELIARESIAPADLEPGPL